MLFPLRKGWAQVRAQVPDQRPARSSSLPIYPVGRTHKAVTSCPPRAPVQTGPAQAGAPPLQAGVRAYVRRRYRAVYVAAEAAAPKELTIVHFNDVRSRLRHLLWGGAPIGQHSAERAGAAWAVAPGGAPVALLCSSNPLLVHGPIAR